MDGEIRDGGSESSWRTGDFTQGNGSIAKLGLTETSPSECEGSIITDSILASSQSSIAVKGDNVLNFALYDGKRGLTEYGY